MLLVLFALVPALGLMIYTGAEQRRLAADRAQEDALRLARITANSQEQRIDAAHQLLKGLAEMPPIRDGDSASCSDYLTSLLKLYPQYSVIGVADRQGDVLCRSNPLTSRTNIGSDSLVQLVFDTGDFAVGDYRIASSGRTVRGFGYPLLDAAGQTRRIIYTAVDLDWLNQIVAESLLPTGSTLTMTDRHGTVVARVPDPEKWLGRPLPEAPVAAAIANRQAEGTIEARGEDGIPRLYAFTSLRQEQDTHTYISIAIPVAVAYAEVNRWFVRTVLALGLVAIAALGAAWLGARLFVLRPIDALLRTTARLADGDLSARTEIHSGVTELSHLASAFDRMVLGLEQRQEDRDRAQEQTSRQAARAEALVNAASRLNAQLDLETLLAAICEETARALHVPAAAVSLGDGHSDPPGHAVAFGLPPDDPGKSDCAEIGDGTQFRAIATAPMAHGQEPIGTLSACAPDSAPDLSGDDLILLKGLAAQAALSISNARLYETLRQEQRTVAGLLHNIISAQEDERMRIARELHDETSQGLYALMLDLDHASLFLADDVQKAAGALRTARFVAEGMVDDIHRLIEDLRPTLLDILGLREAIIGYGEKRLGPFGIGLHVEEDGLDDRLSFAMKTALFRVAQEALTNIVRHAHATEVRVRLSRQNGSVTLRITDNGQGFAPSVLTEPTGFGLRGMQERVSILGGVFHLQSTPGHGTVIDVRVPTPHEEVLHAEDPRAGG